MTLYALKMIYNGYDEEESYVIGVYDSEEKANIQGELEMKKVKKNAWYVGVEEYTLNETKEW